MSMTTRTTKLPRIGDIWLVNYPYSTPGNMEKVRPGIIIDFDGDDRVVVQKLTTKRKRNNKDRKRNNRNSSKQKRYKFKSC